MRLPYVRPGLTSKLASANFRKRNKHHLLPDLFENYLKFSVLIWAGNLALTQDCITTVLFQCWAVGELEASCSGRYSVLSFSSCVIILNYYYTVLYQYSRILSICVWVNLLICNTMVNRVTVLNLIPKGRNSAVSCWEVELGVWLLVVPTASVQVVETGNKPTP